MSPGATRESVFLYGAGYLGQQILHHVRAYYSEQCTLLGFVDDTRGAGEEVSNGLLTLGPLQDLSQDPKAGCRPGQAKAIFAIGYGDMVGRRAALDRLLSETQAEDWVGQVKWLNQFPKSTIKEKNTRKKRT